MFILPPRLRQETSFYDPDLFLFAYIIKYYITTNIIVLWGGGGIVSTTNVDQSLLNFTLF